VLSAAVAALAFLTFLASGPPARAEVVFTSSGTIQTFNLTSDGTTVTVTFPDIELLDNVNGHPIPDILTMYTDPFHLTILSKTNLGGGTWVMSFSSDVGLKSVNPAGPSADFSYTLDTGAGFGQIADAFTITGPELLLVNGLAPAYDFSPYFAGGTLTFAMTSTSRSNQGSGSFADLIANGGTAQGTIAFSEVAAAAVPEPGALVLAAAAGLFTAGGWFVRRRPALA
jgi:hypothetical protein